MFSRFVDYLFTDKGWHKFTFYFLTFTTVSFATLYTLKCLGKI
jgi:hypothetical protein